MKRSPQLLLTSVLLVFLAACSAVGPTQAFVEGVESARAAEPGFELAGLVTRVLVEEGDPTEAGQLLIGGRRRLGMAANLVEARHRLHRRSSSPSHAPNLPDGTRPRAPGWIEILVRGES